MINDLYNLGIYLQIFGILLAFPIKLIFMYSIVLKKTYEIVVKNNEEIIENRPKNIYIDWLMFKIQIKISQINWKKWFKLLTKNFGKDYPEAFRPNSGLVTIGGTIIILGLILTLK